MRDLEVNNWAVFFWVFFLRYFWEQKYLGIFMVSDLCLCVGVLCLVFLCVSPRGFGSPHPSPVLAH